MPSQKYFPYLVFLICAVLGMTYPVLAANLAEEDKSALVILNYGRIDESYSPETNLAFTHFEEQISRLKAQNYHILSLRDALNAYDKNQPLPQKSIAITFEGAYKSTLSKAIPLLLKHKMPFTLFYAANSADDSSGDAMNWDDLKRLHNNPLVTLGVLPASYTRLTGQDKAIMLTDLNRAKAKHRDMFAEEPVFLSYPYGEYDKTLKTLARELGYRAAFGMQSGVVSAQSDRFELPRFSITEEYGEPDDFNTIINTLPMGASAVEPSIPIVNTATPTLGFTLPIELESQKRDLICFTSDQPKPSIEFVGTTRIELRLAKPITEPRTQINCVLPVKAADTAREDDAVITNWRWLGFLLIHPQPAP